MKLNTKRPSTETMECLLRQTIAPQQRGLLLEFIRSLQDEFEEVQSEINRHKAHIRMYEVKQVQLVDTIAQYKAYLAPVHRLPSEILQEIFLYVSARIDIDDRLPFHFTLSIVSARWRHIVNSTPRLWSSLRISIPQPHFFCSDDQKARFFAKTKRYIQRLDLCLERSQNSPLTLDIRQWGTLANYQLGDRAPENVILSSLNAHSLRWKDVRISGCAEDFLQSSPANPTPNLRHLSLTVCTRCPDEKRHFDRFKHLESSPLLTSVSLNLDSPESLDLPWSRLRTVELRDRYRGEKHMLQNLRQAQSLENLKFVDASKFGKSTESTKNLKFVKLDAVRTLTMTLSYKSNDDVLDFLVLRNLHLTNLSSLILKHDRVAAKPLDAENLGHLTDFFTRSCLITSLQVSAVSFSDAQLISVLQLLPSLTNLGIRERVACDNESTNKMITRPFIDRLVVPRQMINPFLPQLTALSLLLYTENLDSQALSDALVSRCLQPRDTGSDTGTVCLKKVDITLISKERERKIENPLVAGPLANLECFNDVGVRFIVTNVVK